MQSKLTLRLDEDLIGLAKDYARERGKSVSQLVADYFVYLAANKEPEKPLPPTTRSLVGVLAGEDLDEEDYKSHLEEKYL